jgi:hypothetical protein
VCWSVGQIVAAFVTTSPRNNRGRLSKHVFKSTNQHVNWFQSGLRRQAADRVVNAVYGAEVN